MLYCLFFKLEKHKCRASLCYKCLHIKAQIWSESVFSTFRGGFKCSIQLDFAGCISIPTVRSVNRISKSLLYRLQCDANKDNVHQSDGDDGFSVQKPLCLLSFDTTTTTKVRMDVEIKPNTKASSVFWRKPAPRLVIRGYTTMATTWTRRHQ